MMKSKWNQNFKTKTERLVNIMTFQEAHKDGKNGLVTRIGLTEDELRTRLNFYFFNEE